MAKSSPLESYLASLTTVLSSVPFFLAFVESLGDSGDLELRVDVLYKRTLIMWH